MTVAVDNEVNMKRVKRELGNKIRSASLTKPIYDSPFQNEILSVHPHNTKLIHKYGYKF